LRGACAGTCPPGCCPAMPWANPLQYSLLQTYGRGKLSLRSIKHHVRETYKEWRYSFHTYVTLAFAGDEQSTASLFALPLCPLDTRLCGPQSRYGCCGEKPHAGNQNLLLGRPACHLVVYRQSYLIYRRSSLLDRYKFGKLSNLLPSLLLT
jgi:hypothetical protein